MGNITQAERERRAADQIQAHMEEASRIEVSTAAAAVEVETPSGKRITRNNRKGFGNQSQKLAVSERPGYFRYWFNDTPGRVVGAQESGYTHVMDPVTGRPMQHVVGVSSTGGPLIGYLMEIPKEWHDDDMAEQEKINLAKEEAIKGGVQPSKNEDKNAFYPTAQGRRIQIDRR